MTDDKDPGDLTGAYALDGVDADELAEFEAHLANSRRARDEVTELRDTAALLGLAVEPVQPSPALKHSIMAQLDAHPQLPSDDQSAAGPGPAERRAAARWFRRPVTALVAVAAAVALVVAGGVITTTLNQTGIVDQQNAELAAITAADDAQRASVELPDGGTAMLVWSNALSRSAIHVEPLPALPADRQYQLWYIDGSGARSAGTFDAPLEADAWQVLEGTMLAGDKVGVTVEPRGGSEVPTTDPIVVIESA